MASFVVTWWIVAFLLNDRTCQVSATAQGIKPEHPFRQVFGINVRSLYGMMTSPVNGYGMHNAHIAYRFSEWVMHISLANFIAEIMHKKWFIYGSF